jgi:outer membrane protein OmpA-like peptidoglycan-associated protein
MRNMLLASVAAAGLALAIPAFAQDLPNAVPATPSITTETPANPDAGLNGQAESAVRTPEGSVRAETQTQAEAQADAETPAEAAEAAAAMAASPAAPDATMAAETPAAPTTTAEAPAATIPATASAVCQPRVTSVHFGARGSSLSQQNRNAIEQAVDAASVCDLQQIQIVDSANGNTSTRRASAVRATLIRQGVPAERITIAEEANADAEASSTGRLDVRMNFAGVADAGTPVATAAPATPTPPDASAPATPESGS